MHGLDGSCRARTPEGDEQIPNESEPRPEDFPESTDPSRREVIPVQAMKYGVGFQILHRSVDNSYECDPLVMGFRHVAWKRKDLVQ